MYSTTTWNTSVYPAAQPNAEAYITKGKNRLKQYPNKKLYLNDGDHFEIELFNPRSNSVLAKIKINGNYISTSGIVLKPAERVFLERYLKEDRKFKFGTYNVDGDSAAVKAAIQKNGLVEVEFYDENVVPTPTIQYLVTPTVLYGNGLNTANNFYSTCSLDGVVGTGTVTCATASVGSTTNLTSNASNQTYTSRSLNTKTFHDNSAKMKGILRSASLETGRVEKGEVSAQTFETVHMDFNTWVTSTTSWQIFPESVKPVEVQEATAKFCTQCGAKIKKASFKFCPNCGADLSIQ